MNSKATVSSSYFVNLCHCSVVLQTGIQVQFPMQAGGVPWVSVEQSEWSVAHVHGLEIITVLQGWSSSLC